MRIDMPLTHRAITIVANHLNTDPEKLIIEPVSGGYSLNRRAVVSNGSDRRFVKEVDASLVQGDGAIELAWLRKDYECTKALQRHMPSIVADSVDLSEDGHTLILPAYQATDGWLWQPPVEPTLQPQYIQAVIGASNQLETVRFDDETIARLQLQPFLASEVFDNDSLANVANDAILRSKLTLHFNHYMENAADAYLIKSYQCMRDFLNNPRAIKTASQYARTLLKQPENCLGHCDLRSDNLAYNPSTGRVVVVDWNWAAYAPSKAGNTEFLINLAGQGIDISEWHDELNPALLIATVGFYLPRCIKPPFSPGNPIREMQTIAAATALSTWQQITS